MNEDDKVKAMGEFYYEKLKATTNVTGAITVVFVGDHHYTMLRDLSLHQVIEAAGTLLSTVAKKDPFLAMLATTVLLKRIKEEVDENA